MLFKSTLLRTAADFRPMFTALLQIRPDAKEAVDENIAWAKRILKREDRIVWYLRWFRFLKTENLVHESGNPFADQDKGNPLVQLKKQYERDLLNKGVTQEDVAYSVVRLRELRRQLEHFMGIESHDLQNYHFQASASVPNVLNTLHTLEEEYKKSLGRKIVPRTEDTIVLSFDDGWAWWLLPRAYCSDEARAMGHCGNSPQEGNPDLQILSLRQSKKVGDETRWEPHCTFIFNAKNGTLGEMKGRNNDKPVEKYHKYIIALLKLPMIKGVLGGGYLPSHNFKVNDLSDELRKDLHEVRPDLVGDGTVSGSIMKILETLELSKNDFDEETQMFTVRRFANAGEFLESIDGYGGGASEAVALWDGSNQPDAPRMADLIELIEKYSGKSVYTGRNADGTQKFEENPDYMANLGYSLLYEYKFDPQMPKNFDPEDREDVVDFLDRIEPKNWSEHYNGKAETTLEKLAQVWYVGQPDKYAAESEMDQAMVYLGSTPEDSPWDVEIETSRLDAAVTLRIDIEHAEKAVRRVESGKSIPEWTEGLVCSISSEWTYYYTKEYAPESTQRALDDEFGSRPKNPYPIGKQRLFKEPDSNYEAKEDGITVASLHSRLLRPFAA